MVTEKCGSAGGFLNLNVTYSNLPTFEFVTLMIELAVLQLAAQPKLGATIVKTRTNRNLKKVKMIIPYI